jgi:hypothetical protein
VDATGLSDHYCSLIRLGKRVPHARHWPALSRARDLSAVGGPANRSREVGHGTAPASERQIEDC